MQEEILHRIIQFVVVLAIICCFLNQFYEQIFFGDCVLYCSKRNKGSSDNSCILHYNLNSSLKIGKQLLPMDAGAECYVYPYRPVSDWQTKSY
jgi:hypothetical protein